MLLGGKPEASLLTKFALIVIFGFRSDSTLQRPWQCSLKEILIYLQSDNFRGTIYLTFLSRLSPLGP